MITSVDKIEKTIKKKHEKDKVYTTKRITQMK